MKMIKTVKLQRVRHGDLDEGDDWKLDDPDFNYIQTKGMGIASDDELVIAYDVDKYPPEEVTYTIEGIAESELCSPLLRVGKMFLQEPFFPESKIETRYI